MSKAAWITVFIVLFSSALPVLFHLPLWVSVLSALAVIWRIIKKKFSNAWLDRSIITALMLAGIVGIYLSFPTFFGGDAILSFFVLIVAFKWAESKTRRDALLMIFATVILSAIGGMYWHSLLSLINMLFIALLLIIALIAINDSQGVIHWRELIAKAGALFLLSLPLMILFFITLPRIPGPIWDIGIAFGMPVNLVMKRTHSGPLLGKSLKPAQISRLSQSDDVVLVAEFSNDYVPYKSRMYWRGPVYYNFDGHYWQLDEKLDSGQAMKSTGYKRKNDYDKIIHHKSLAVSYSARVNANGNHWLYALELPYGAFPETRISKNLQLVSVRSFEQTEFKYEMTGYLDYQVGTDISEKQRQRALSLPVGNNPRLQQFSQQLKQTNQNPTDLIQAVLKEFASNNYVFNQQVQIDESKTDLDDFFFTKKQGNAMHFASSFVIIMRHAGIPARLVTGFRGGDLIALTDFVIVRNKHTHVWPEIWDETQGWLRIEVKDIVTPPASEIRANRKPKTNGSTEIKAENIKPKATKQIDKNKTTKTIKPKANKNKTSSWLNWGKSLDKWILNYNPNRQIDLFSKTGIKKVNWSMLLIWSILGVLSFLAIYIIISRYTQRSAINSVDLYWHKFIKTLNKIGIITSVYECPSNLQKRIFNENKDIYQGTEKIINTYIKIKYGTATVEKPTPLDEFKRLIKRFTSMV